MASLQWRRRRCLWLIALCIMFTSVSSQSSSSDTVVAATRPPPTETDPPEAEAPETTAPTTDPPETTRPATDPPETDPPETTAPATDPPETDPPETDPPETDPPDTTAPATAPPKTTAPETTPPTTRPPATEPPATDPPETEAPETNVPATATDPPETAAPATTARAKTPTTPTPTTEDPTTSAPVVEHYNSSTLPPEVDLSMLNGSELVAVEVTETSLANGSTSYSYVIITKMGETEKIILLSPVVSSDDTAAQSSSSASDTTLSTTSSSSLSMGVIVGIIAGAFVFMLVLFAFFFTRRRKKRRPSDASLDESPVVGKHVYQGRSLADTEYREMTRTTANSPSSGGTFPNSSHYQATLWEHPVILASRIPIDRVELGIVIGRGAFGEVFRGRYRDHDVAVKTLLPEKRKDLAHIQAFLSEVLLTATMEHPHIVQFIGVAWESLSEVYCVTEYMGGGDLRALLKDYLAHGIQQGMDNSKMKIAYQVAYALTYLHSLNPVVLHRDLKSRNILLTEALNAKITDFGASRIRSDASMTSGVGSALWMAPEVMMGRHYDEKADVFSLGVVMSELDTHEMPYSHAKESGSSSGRPLPDTAVLQMVSMGTLRVHFSPYLHPDVASFVESCVSVDPQQRPTAAEALYFLHVAIRDQQY